LNTTKSTNAELDRVLTSRIITKKEAEQKKENNSKKDKITKTIELQEKILEDIRKGVLTNNKNADLIYSNYALVQNIIKSIQDARTKYSWNEIKEKLKGNRLVKRIDEKQGKLTIIID
jgi:predicted ribosome quality control (RQC) complex YloA/Tae2 family protein